MIQNRELTMDDYLAMLRRRAKVILIPALLAPLVGFLLSYAFTPTYTSRSLILVESQKVPENMVQPVVSQDLTARVATLQQQVLSQTRLQPIVERLYPGKNSQEIGEIIDTIRQNMAVEPVVADLAQIGPKKKPGAQSAVPGFYVSYTASKPREAQQICTELTTLLLDENLKSLQAAASGTSDVLSKGLEDSKHNLEELDSKLAAFKKQYVGQLPGDEENNLKILMGLNSQLEAEHPDAEPGAAGQDVHRVGAGAAAGSVEINAIFDQSADAGKTVVRLAIATLESAGALYRRPSRCDQDEGRHRGSEKATGGNQQSLGKCGRHQLEGFGQ